MSLQPTTLASITRIFDSLDYAALGPIYCDEGGDAFWEERRGAWPEPRIHHSPAPHPRLPPTRPGRCTWGCVTPIPPRGLCASALHPEVPPSELPANSH